MTDIQIPDALKDNVDLLGTMLGKAFALAEGQGFLEKIEVIRHMAKLFRSDGLKDHHRLATFLGNLTNEEMGAVAKAFSHFLNLANIADQQYTISRSLSDSATQILSDLFAGMTEAGHSAEKIEDQIGRLKIELVLTAHPTEITRRTVINKHTEMIALLSQLELQGHTEDETQIIRRRLAELITQMWHTEDFRIQRPTPVHEARWGFAVIENSLWDAVPNFLRQLESACQAIIEKPLSLDFVPVSIISWMGGDRDGNPNVTARVSRQVLLLSRRKCLGLYMKDIQNLMDDLAVSNCNSKIRQMTDGKREPYRLVLRGLLRLLQSAGDSLESALEGGSMPSPLKVDQLWQPLFDCYESLCQCGMNNIANGKLLDLLRRIKSFGMHLTKLDIRQESSRHTKVLTELTSFLGLGAYNDWNESEKESFLLKELQNPRPLIPNHWQCSADSLEVLDTFREIAKHPADAFGVYVISMARAASDVLTVQLLMKECGFEQLLPVAPLFETLDDLNNAAGVMQRLSEIDWYRKISDCKQMIMIGYSDSAKDAGGLAAGWAQYQAQEALLKVCAQVGFELTLFHGRGGTIDRGGTPAYAALLSQPPGSLHQGLRVTEQGETIRNKFGGDALALKNLALYASAIIQANLAPPPKPKKKWQQAMDELAELSCTAYRKVVRDTPGFVDYFRAVTPERELALLPLGSRPPRRQSSAGIESLRAIPWVFAWSQNRLMLPAWLGQGEALQKIIDRGDGEVLEEMCKSWPFFSVRLSMLEIVYANADVAISEYYDSRLTDQPESKLGGRLRQQILDDMKTLLKIRNDHNMMGDLSATHKSIQFRNTYVDPLNILQADLLQRYRASKDEHIEKALMMTIAGISAGLRHTG